MAQPSREEIIAYITKVAQEKGIDPQVMLAIVNGESGFNPAAVGDQGQSFGLAQLYMGGGLGNTYEQQYGKPPSDPNDWQQQINFMADQAVSGGKGWEPWHASARAGIGPQQGLPGGPTGPVAAVSRGRGGQVMPPAQVQATPGQGQGNEGILAELQNMMKPQRTIGSELFKMTGIDKGDATTLGGLAFNTLTGRDKQTAKAQAALAKENPFSAVPTETDKLAKKKVAVPMMAATGQQPSAKPQTVGSGIFSWLRGLG